MYIRFVYIIFFLHLSMVCFSQNKGCGLFLTAEDFKNNNAMHCSEDTRIRHHDLFKKDIIEVKTKDSTYKYQKKNIYGYREDDGNTYRVYQGKTYPILNPNETILLYKVSGGPAMKGQEQTYSYYFSKDASGKIMPLSLGNIEQAFKENQYFGQLLELHFKSDDDLMEYDEIHQVYKLNRLLQLAKEGNK